MKDEKTFIIEFTPQKETAKAWYAPYVIRDSDDGTARLESEGWLAKSQIKSPTKAQDGQVSGLVSEWYYKQALIPKSQRLA